MTDLTDLRKMLEQRAERGELRGAHAVFERAAARTPADLHPDARNTRRRPVRSVAFGVAVATVAITVAVAIGVASQREPGPVPPAAGSTDRLVVLTPGLRVLLTDSSGHPLRTLATNRGVRRGVPTMSVSPDGATLYMDGSRRARTGECAGRGLVEEIVAIPLHGSGAARVVAQGRWPAVSPDGTALAYAAPLSAGGTCADPSGIVVRNLLTGAEHRWALSTTSAADDDFVASLSWAPDSLHLGFAEFSTPTRIHVLDTQRPGTLTDAPITPLASNLSWAGYLGATGLFLSVEEPRRSHTPARIVAIEPSTGLVTRQLLRFNRPFWDSNSGDQINDGVVADRTGKALLIIAARAANSSRATLYSWRAQDRRLRSIPRSGVAAVWVPQNRCHRRTFPVGGSCERTRERPPSTTQVADQLVAGGHTVTRDQSARTPSGFLGAAPTVLCVDHHTVNVYEYGSLAEREAQSNALQPDGSLRYPTGSKVLPKWTATPHFFATQRLLVVYVGEDSSIVRSLHAILGPAIPTNARGRGGFDQC